MLPAEYDITGKVVFITGAGRGIGKGIAQVLAEAGADIALNALTPKYVEGTAAEIAKSSGQRVVPVMADVTNTDGVQGAIDTVMKEFGHIDILINNLGDSIRKPLVALPGKANATQALSDDELKFVMDINLTEAILCTRAVGPHMLEQRSGKVINISSWTARQGGGEMVVYTIAQDGSGRLYACPGAGMGAVWRLRQRYCARDLSGSGDLRGGTRSSNGTARRPDSPVRTAWTAARGGIAGALFGVSGIELHDRADDLPRWGDESVGWAEVGFLSPLPRGETRVRAKEERP
jgi:NAD(P)-dependent dehydrogenase (short-subunit alcohol dehydrogenase family)